MAELTLGRAVMTDLVLAGYAEAAPHLFERYDALDTRAVNTPILHLFPSEPCRVLDIGAGTGRDAVYFADLDHDVVAVEPTDGLREGGRIRHARTNIEWIADRLPHLDALAGRSFDFIKLTAVWAHLDPVEQVEALPEVAALLAPGGCLAFSVKHGFAPADRPAYAVSIDDTIQRAAALGLECVLHVNAPSIQVTNRDLGVTWTWLAFEAPRRQ